MIHDPQRIVGVGAQAEEKRGDVGFVVAEVLREGVAIGTGQDEEHAFGHGIEPPRVDHGLTREGGRDRAQGFHRREGRPTGGLVQVDDAHDAC